MLVVRSSLLQQNRILARRHYPLTRNCNNNKNNIGTNHHDAIMTTRIIMDSSFSWFHSGRTLQKMVKGKKPNTPKKKSAKELLSETTTTKEEEGLVHEFDPHALASEMIQKSPDGRIQGTEAIASMTPEQKMRNYATAATLVGFVTFVWWYSMQSVGRNTSSNDENEDSIELRLREEAKDATNLAKAKTISEDEVKELAQLDVTLAGEHDDGDDDMIVAVAAPDDIATAEEDLNLGKKVKQSASRPLWKKIVFFWKRD